MSDRVPHTNVDTLAQLRTENAELRARLARYESVPEPAPVCEGRAVTDDLIKWVASNYGPEIGTYVVGLLLRRDAYGLAKYGQRLMTDDGRDSVEDARQEFGDLLQYAYKALVNGEDLTELRTMLPVLSRLITATNYESEDETDRE